MRWIFLLVASLLIVPVFGQARLVELTAVIPDYSGDSIEIYQNINYLTGEQRLLAKTVVDNDGNFRIGFPLEACSELSVPLGVYSGHLYAEPGKKYALYFPPKTEKSERERLNPYFKPVEFYFGIKDDTLNSINNAIPALSDTISYFYQANYTLFLTRRGLRQAIDSFLTVLKNFAPELEENAYWNVYQEYSGAMLLFSADLVPWQQLSSRYFVNRPIALDNPAWVELFSQVFTAFFPKLNKTRASEALNKFLDDELSYAGFKNEICHLPGLKDRNLVDLIVLKTLHDDYFSGKIDATFCLKIIDEVIAQTPVDEIRETASYFKAKIKRLLPGAPAPEFNLFSADSGLHSLVDYRGKYVYLLFSQEQNFACMAEYEVLDHVHKKFKKYLDVLLIDTGLNFHQFVNSMLDKGYHWTFLHYGNHPTVLTDYRVKAFPTAILIDPYGRVLQAPALLPNEGFESSFQRILNKRD